MHEAKEKEDEGSEVYEFDEYFLWFESNDESMIDLMRMISYNFIKISDRIWSNWTSFDALIRVFVKWRGIE